MKSLLRCLPLLVCLFAVSPASGREAHFSVFYTADTHGHIASSISTIGLDKVAGLMQSQPGALLLDAGDFLHGLPLINLDQGKAVLHIMKETGYFAATLGNHEFSHGQSALRQRLTEASQEPELHLLSANTRAENGELLAKAWTSTVIDGVNVCIFGLTTPETRVAASPPAVRGLIFEDPLQTALAVFDELRGQGCSFIVALSHLGSISGTETTSLALARAVSGIDVIIDGHSHVELEDASSGPLVISPGAYSQRVGRLDVTFDTVKGKTVSLKNRLLTPEEVRGVEADQRITRKIEDLRLQQDSLFGKEVTTSETNFPGDTGLNRIRETTMGNLCADALRGAYGAELAIINGGGIRAAFRRGIIRLKDVNAVLPFGGYAVNVQVSGQELWDILEHAYGSLPRPFGGFAQISGFTVRVAPSNPPGSRLIAVDMPSGPLQLDRQYTLTVNDFLSYGGDGYPHLAAKARMQAYMPMQDALANFLTQIDTRAYRLPQKRIVMEP